jgi:hypothetical protein
MKDGFNVVALDSRSYTPITQTRRPRSPRNNQAVDLIAIDGLASLGRRSPTESLTYPRNWTPTDNESDLFIRRPSRDIGTHHVVSTSSGDLENERGTIDPPMIESPSSTPIGQPPLPRYHFQLRDSATPCRSLRRWLGRQPRFRV